MVQPNRPPPGQPAARRAMVCLLGGFGWALVIAAFLGNAGQAVAGPTQPTGSERSPADSVKPPAPDELAIDRDLTIFEHIEDRAPVRSSDANYDEAVAYNLLLGRAHRASAEAFARKARTDIHHYHLWEEPERYRCQIVHVEGQLRQLRRFPAPKLAQKGDTPDLYEAWIFDDRDKGNPWCLVFTDLPPGLEVDGSVGQHVEFDGYFFKLYRYKDQKGESRLAPLLIGHSPVLTVREGANGDLGRYFSTTFVLGFLSLFSVIVLATVGLSWWFRRSDAKVRLRLAQIRDGQVPGPPTGEEVSAPGFPAEPGSKEEEAGSV